MELRQLKYFTKAAELLNFTEAAQLCFISQSTLSQQIKQLEIELGTPLFDRIGKHITLTETGRSFLPYAMKSLQDADAGKQIAKDILELRTGELNIGVTFGLSAVFSKALVRFAELYPEVKVNVEFGTSEYLIGRLKGGHLNFNLSFARPGRQNGIESIFLFESPLMLVCHPNHVLGRLRKVNIAQLERMPLILPSRQFNTRQTTERLFQNNKVHPLVQLELNDIHVLMNLLLDSGKWCSILTKSTKDMYPQLKAIPFTGKEILQQASVSWLEKAYRPKSALVFTRMIDAARPVK